MAIHNWHTRDQVGRTEEKSHEGSKCVLFFKGFWLKNLEGEAPLAKLPSGFNAMEQYFILEVQKHIIQLLLTIFLVGEKRTHSIITYLLPGFTWWNGDLAVSLGMLSVSIFSVPLPPLLVGHFSFFKEESSNFLLSYLEFWEICRGDRFRVLWVSV